MRPGTSRARLSVTPTTRCCRKRWRSGLFLCWSTCFPATFRSFMKSTGASSSEVAAAYPGDTARLARMSVIEESAPKQVRMANLAIVGSHSINGVSAIHTQLLKTTLAPDFYRLWPERFNNKTNGITQRRWLLKANPSLAELISLGDRRRMDHRSRTTSRARELMRPMRGSRPSSERSSERTRNG